jgi:hypothetical protein
MGTALAPEPTAGGVGDRRNEAIRAIRVTVVSRPVASLASALSTPAMR